MNEISRSTMICVNTCDVDGNRVCHRSPETPNARISEVFMIAITIITVVCEYVGSDAFSPNHMKTQYFE